MTIIGLLPRPDARSQNRDRVRKDTDADKVAAIVAARAKGTGVRRIARELGVGVGTVLRVTDQGGEL
jgi:DNA invertase Pin-like site-specific DNA recombinase